MPYVKPMSEVQTEYMAYLRYGLKADGYTFGKDAQTRMSEWRAGDFRVMFIPCDRTGWPVQAKGANRMLGYAHRMMSSVWGSGNPARAVVNLFRNVAFGSANGAREVVELFANPNSFEIKYARGERTKGDTLGDKKGRVNRRIQNPTGYSDVDATTTSMRGRLRSDWSTPSADITLSGHCGNAPEIQIPRLKYVFGMFDPSGAEKGRLVKQGNLTVAQATSNEYPTDPALYLWEMLYPVVNWPTAEADNHPWKSMAFPQRYFGYVDGLSFIQQIERDSQTDIKWEMTFKVLQRRDYDNIGP